MTNVPSKTIPPIRKEKRMKNILLPDPSVDACKNRSTSVMPSRRLDPMQLARACNVWIRFALYRIVVLALQNVSSLPSFSISIS